MLEVRVEHLGDVQFEVAARGHKLICDQPVEAGGYDEGMTPPEFLLASLGSCAAYYAADYLKRLQLAGVGTRVRVTAEKATGPARLDRFHVTVEAPLALTEQQESGLLRAVERCLVHNTLLHPPEITITVQREPALALAS
jgi:putative redox protein